MTDKNDMEELFSSVFGGAEMIPPDSVKEAIDAALFPPVAVVKKRRALWIWPFALLLLLGGVSALVFFAGDGENTNNESQIAQENGQLNENSQDNTNANTQDLMSSSQEDAPMYAENSDLDQAHNQEALNRGNGGAEKFHDESKDQGVQKGDGFRKGKKIPEANGNGSLADDQLKGNDTGDQNLLENDQLSDTESGNDLQNEEREQTENVDALGIHAPEHFNGPEAGDLLAGPESRLNEALNQSPWSLAAYVGASFGMNKIRGTSDLTMEEQAGVYVSVEAIYPISRSFSLSAGLDFTQRLDRLTQDFVNYDSIFTGNTVVYIYDSAQVVIDSVVTPNYASTTLSQQSSGTIRFYSIGIPIYLHYQMPIGRTLSLDLSVGVRCSYMKYTNEDLVPNIIYPETYKQFGVNVSFRPELLIPINRVQLGVYGRFEYDALHGMQWNAITRTRWSAGFGLSLRYKL